MKRKTPIIRESDSDSDSASASAPPPKQPNIQSAPTPNNSPTPTRPTLPPPTPATRTPRSGPSPPSSDSDVADDSVDERSNDYFNSPERLQRIIKKSFTEPTAEDGRSIKAIYAYLLRLLVWWRDEAGMYVSGAKVLLDQVLERAKQCALIEDSTEGLKQFQAFIGIIIGNCQCSASGDWPTDWAIWGVEAVLNSVDTKCRRRQHVGPAFKVMVEDVLIKALVKLGVERVGVVTYGFEQKADFGLEGDYEEAHFKQGGKVVFIPVYHFCHVFKPLQRREVCSVRALGVVNALRTVLPAQMRDFFSAEDSYKFFISGSQLDWRVFPFDKATDLAALVKEEEGAESPLTWHGDRAYLGFEPRPKISKSKKQPPPPPPPVIPTLPVPPLASLRLFRPVGRVHLFPKSGLYNDAFDPTDMPLKPRDSTKSKHFKFDYLKPQICHIRHPHGQFCGKEFTNRIVFRVHLKRDHLHKFACEVCKFPYTSNEKLKEHRKLSATRTKGRGACIPAESWQPLCKICYGGRSTTEPKQMEKHAANDEHQAALREQARSQEWARNGGGPPTSFSFPDNFDFEREMNPLDE